MRGKVSAKLKPFLAQVNLAIAEAKQNKQAFTVAQTRENLNKLGALISKGPELAYVENTTLNNNATEIPVRIYSPAPDEKLPVVLHFHGGGHMCGSIELYDNISRKIACFSHCIVITIDYRLAPEYPYPTGLNDCEYLLRNYQQLLANIHYNEQLYVLGDSAGGAICTTLTAKSQYDDTLKIDKQILIYPSVDYTLSSESIQSNGTGYLLETAKIAWYFDHYFQHNENREKASPLFQDITQKLPKTLIITAGCDPLRDEGLAYAGALTAAGVAVNHQHFADLTHAYMLLETLVKQECQQSYQLIADFIKGS